MSGTNSYKREHGLSIEQLNAIELLITGKSDKEVAEAVGVNRVTVTKWRLYDPYFQAELNKRRTEIWDTTVDKLRSLLPVVIDKLETALLEEGPHSYKIALEVIKLVDLKKYPLNETGHNEAEDIIGEQSKKNFERDLFNFY